MASGVRRGAGRTSGKRAAFSPAMRPSSAASCSSGRSSLASPAMKIGALPALHRVPVEHAARRARRARATCSRGRGRGRSACGRWRRARSRRSPRARRRRRRDSARAPRRRRARCRGTSAFGSSSSSRSNVRRAYACERRVAERADVAAAAEDARRDAEPVQRLPELEADHARAEDGDRARQVVPVEDVVVDDEAIARGAQDRRDRRATSRWRSPPGRTRSRVWSSTVERAVVDETRVAADAVRRRDRVDAFEHEADEAVALALHARHHRLAVDSRRVPSRRRPNSGQRSRPCAASAAAISSLLGMQPTRAQVVPYGAALDQDGALARGDRGAIRGEAGGAGADDGDIHVDLLHRLSFESRRGRSRALTTAAGVRATRARRPLLMPPCAPSARALRGRRCACR